MRIRTVISGFSQKSSHALFLSIDAWFIDSVLLYLFLFSQGKLGVPGLPGYPGRQGPKVIRTDKLLC